ncbi:uncharacterized protein [Chelonus insularis]|uniref:uncharacterized protein n=1 Tax=Chelonus insularis TaxID=460826 RepID=UPI00158F6757|nr:uncharacterized protein LOC118069963 [Chelonus insularis]
MVKIQLLIVSLMLFVYLPQTSFSIIRIRESERRIECQGCRNECDKCEYGVAVSEQCGVLECRKGPDEPCGGENNAGVCGDGMICLCERCVGCSVDTLQCSKSNFNQPCLPGAESSHDIRFLDFGDRRHRLAMVK